TVSESPQGEVHTPAMASDIALDWRPAATSIPDGMEILVGEPAQSDKLSEIENSQEVGAEAIVADPPDKDLTPAAELVNCSSGIRRRVTSPVMASLVLHGAILFLTVSITVA